MTYPCSSRAGQHRLDRKERLHWQERGGRLIDEDLDSVIANIYAERSADTGRPVEFED